MADRLILHEARLASGATADVVIGDARIEAIERPGSIAGDVAARHLFAAGRLLTPGLTDVHLHPDKAYLLGEIGGAGSLAQAIAAVRRRKPDETEAAVFERTMRLLRACREHGTTAVRLHAEVDPLLGLTSVRAVLAARHAARRWMTVQVCAFAQEGIASAPGTLNLLERAIDAGADVVGGITYQDPDVVEHLETVGSLAARRELPLDLHADLSIPPERTALHHVARVAGEHGLEGRTIVGHCTTLARMAPAEFAAAAKALRRSAVAVVALPRTDLYFDGVVAPLEALDAAGVRAHLATNNVENPFTPVGPPSLPSVAASYALSNKVGTTAGLDGLAHRLWSARDHIDGRQAEISVGAPPDVCLWNVEYPWEIIARGAPPSAVIVRGVVVAGTATAATFASPTDQPA